MSLPWNTGVKQCPNKEFGCLKKFLSSEELDEHIVSCRYTEEVSDVISLTKSLHHLEEKMDKFDRLGLPTLMRRLETLESKARIEGAGRREASRQDLSQELRNVQERLVEIEASNQAIRDDRRISQLSKQVEQLEKNQTTEVTDELADKYRELKISYQKLWNDVSQLRDSVDTGTGGRRRSVLDSGVDEGVQNQIAELRKKQRSEIRGLGDQVDSLTITTNSATMDIRKIRMKINSEIQVEVTELKDKLDRVQRTCWSLEDQLAGNTGAPIGEGKQAKGKDVSREMVNELLDEMGVFDSARDMDGVSVELKLLQTKVDLLEESQRGFKLRLRTLRDHSVSLESDEHSVGAEEEGVEKLFEEIRKLKTSLAVTNTELQAGFKRMDNRVEQAEHHINETQQTMELVRYPNDNRLIRLEQLVNNLQDSTADRSAGSFDHKVDALRLELGNKMSCDTNTLRKKLEECEEHNRDCVDVIQQKCNSLYSECSSLNRKIDQISRQVSDKKPVDTPGPEELLLHLEMGVKELQESYDSRLEQTSRQSDELSLRVDTVSRDIEQIQNGLMNLDKEVKKVWGEEGVVQRVDGIEEFLQRDLPSMGLTTSQKATLEKLIEERSDSVKAILTEEIAEQVVEMRKMIPDIANMNNQIDKLQSTVKSQHVVDYTDQKETDKEIEDKMEKFRRQVRELDHNAAKIFQSLTADMNKLTPKLETAHIDRINNLELEMVVLKDTINRKIKQDNPKLQRQPESLPNMPIDTTVSHNVPEIIPVKPSLPSRSNFSNTPPLTVTSSIRAPQSSAPDSYGLELIRRAGERFPTSGERVLRISRVHKTIVEQTTVYSNPFLSMQEGYQLRLQVALLSSQSGVRVKVALEIMPSECDDKLQWPVGGTVRYYVLNQAHDFAHIHLDDNFFFPRPTRSPIVDKSSILTVPNIESTGPYCLNNSLFIRAQILNLSNIC
ncbi:hypothetical protein LOD99_14050 [Oopsacas minuta]|uniref:TRAF1-6 MATH domain-containing protein n=1 Tax=Oopsacas minuta TaxID=111878 RepID=A0AAV7KHV4_9METZ|nr:hypothetical protein LOD99_14050 [Oopsacas minuta]